MINSIGRVLPEYSEGYGEIRPFAGINKNVSNSEYMNRIDTVKKHKASKRRNNLAELIRELEIKDGMTLSFHHHLRNGDKVLNMVMEQVAEMGIKDLTIAASSLFPVHAPLVGWIQKGVVTSVIASYISGPVAQSISQGDLKYPAIMHTHGGRARAIESGELVIDIAFLGAPTSDCCGNINGVQGPAACGTLGYAVSDAEYAKKVVAVTDNLVPYPAERVAISQEYVDYVLVVDSIGDPDGIVSGTTQITRNPLGLKIAAQAVKVIEASGYLKEGMSFQTGAGGTSLAVAHFLKEKMLEEGLVGSFASGGITGCLVDMFEQGMFRALLDVQCFDHEAIRSFRENSRHQAMSASKYGNPHNKGAVVDQLDVMILGATEIDQDFNVNVTTGSDGCIMGGSGGHSDTAAGAKLAIVVTQLVKKRNPIVKESVTTVTTPGESIDVLVTERGIAVNPRREDVRKQLLQAGIHLVDIKRLKEMAYELTGEPQALDKDGRIVAFVEYRDGTLIDVVRKI
ncbi:citrate lyase subunit alpha [Clostridia bacterium]|nr:citrate lyase subunit alpha [Clostridia bacterium]